MQVRDVMTATVFAITPEDHACTVLDVLIEQGISGLPVVDADARVLGMVSELDLIRALRRGVDLHTAAVAELMHRRPIFVEPETDVYEAVEMMEEWQVRRLPVCDRGRLAGIISRGDVLRALAPDLVGV